MSDQQEKFCRLEEYTKELFTENEEEENTVQKTEASGSPISKEQIEKEMKRTKVTRQQH